MQLFGCSLRPYLSLSSIPLVCATKDSSPVTNSLRVYLIEPTGRPPLRRQKLYFASVTENFSVRSGSLSSHSPDKRSSCGRLSRASLWRFSWRGTNPLMLRALDFPNTSPISYALAKAEAENLEYVVVLAGPVLRLYPARMPYVHPTAEYNAPLMTIRDWSNGQTALFLPPLRSAPHVRPRLNSLLRGVSAKRFLVAVSIKWKRRS